MGERAKRGLSALALGGALLAAFSSEASAAPFDALDNAFRSFFSWMQSEYILFSITFVFLLVLFYAIFAAGLARVTAFGEGGRVNRYGKMVSLSMAVLADVGLLFVIASAPGESMRRVLTAVGVFSAIAFSMLVFGVSYLAFKGDSKTWPLTFFTTGLGMVVYGLLAGAESWFSFGWLFVIIGIIWFLLSGNKGEPAEEAPAPLYHSRSARPGIPESGQAEDESRTPSGTEELDKRIQELEHLSEEYEKEHDNALVPAMTEIIAASHRYRNPQGQYGNMAGPAYPTAEQWEKAFMSLRRLTKIKDEFESAHEAIARDSALSSISDGMKDRLISVLQRQANKLIKSSNLLADFKIKYDNGLPP